MFTGKRAGKVIGTKDADDKTQRKLVRVVKYPDGKILRVWDR